MNKVLIVDDEKKIISLLEYNLKKAGYKVYSATNGKEALEKTKRVKPDLVISDIMMPEMDGFEFYKNLRSNDKKKPVPMIFVTASGQTSDFQKGLKLGIDAYIMKPFDPKYLLRKIKELLDK